MTYRLALGPAGLRLRDPGPDRGGRRPVRRWTKRGSWSGPQRHAAFDKDALHETPGARGSDLLHPGGDREAAVRTLAPAPVYFGLELVHQPGVIGVDRRHVVEMVKAGRAANAAGLVISWDLMHAPIDCVPRARRSSVSPAEIGPGTAQPCRRGALLPEVIWRRRGAIACGYRRRDFGSDETSDQSHPQAAGVFSAFSFVTSGTVAGNWAWGCRRPFR